MIIRKYLPLVLFLVLSSTTITNADVKVEFAPTTSPTSFTNITTASYVTIGSGNTVTINNPNVGFFRVSTTVASESLGKITFTGSSTSGNRTLLITRTDQGLSPSQFSSAGCANWGGFEPNGYWETATVQAYITGDLTGSIFAGTIYRLDAEGSILSTITQQPASSANPTCWGITSLEDITGAIRFYRGRLDLLDAHGNISGSVQLDVGSLGSLICGQRGIRISNLTGNVYASGNQNPSNNVYAIDTIDVTGNIGTSSSLRTISTNINTYAGDRNKIKYIRASNIYANIVTPTTASPRGDVIQVIADGDGGGSGEFKGSLTTFSLGGDTSGIDALNLTGNYSATANLGGTVKRAFKVTGNMTADSALLLGTTPQDLAANGDITITGTMGGYIDIPGSTQGDIAITTGALTGRLRIGLSHGSTSQIFLPANGLQGEIIVNGSNTTGTWAGNVKINSVTLSHAGAIYSGASSGVGGGAIGLAPFQLYNDDCDPPNPASSTEYAPRMSDAFTSSSPIKIRFYGPIADADPTTTDPSNTFVQVEKMDMMMGNQWVDATPMFSFSIDAGTDPQSPRTLLITPAAGSVPAGEYRVLPSWEGRLVCADVDGSPEVASFEYRFRIQSDCDMNTVGDWDQISGCEVITDCDCDGDWQLDACQIQMSPGIDVLNNETCLPQEGGDSRIDQCDCVSENCAADFNQVNGLTVQDIFDFLTAWLAADLAADFNGVNGVTVQDIFDYLTAWLAGCEM